DTALQIVPGSHGRWNTPAEQAALDTAEGEMPAGFEVLLRPGEGVAYTPFLIHRGRYRPDPARATIHFAYRSRNETDPRMPVQVADVPAEALAALSAETRAALEEYRPRAPNPPRGGPEC